MKKIKEKAEKKPKEKFDVSFWSSILKLSLVFVILASITGINLSAIFPIHFSFNPYKQAFELTDQAVKSWFQSSLGSNISFKSSTYKQAGLFLTKNQQEQIVSQFNHGTDISKTDGIDQLADYLGLEYVSNDLIYQDEIVNTAIRLLPIIIDSSKTEADEKASYGDVTITKENGNYTATLQHIYIVYLELKDKSRINLKKYITFNQTKENMKFNELLKISGLPFTGSDEQVIEQIYLSLSNASAPNGYTFNFDSQKLKKVSQIKEIFKLDTSNAEKVKLWNQLNNLKISINIGNGEIIGGVSGDNLISNDYDGDEQGKPPTNHNYKFEYSFDFEIDGIRKTYNYKFIPNQISKPPAKPPTEN